MKNIVELQELITKASAKAVCVLKKRITPEEALVVLATESGYDVDSLIAKEWTEDELISTLRKCKSVEVLPEIEAVVTFTESIVPDGTMQAILEEKVKHDGEIWFVHKHDADPHPSNPHAHNYEKNLKLHLGNGQLYMRRDLVGAIGRKDLLEFRGKIARISLPPLEE